MSFYSARKKAGLSQAVVSEKLGVSAAAVSMWENGKNWPTGPRLLEIAKLYGCSVDELVSNDNNSTEHSN